MSRVDRPSWSSWFRRGEGKRLVPRRMDWWLVGTVALLLGFGLLMITSASSISAEGRYGDSLHYAMRQVAGIVLGLGGAAVIIVMPYRWLQRSGWPLYGASLVGLMLVFSPIGSRVYGASRWISVGGINLQPSEFAKIALILLLARYLSANEGRLRDLMGTAFPAIAIPVPMLILLLCEPDFGTTVITCGLVAVMLFIGGLQWRYILTLGSFAVAGLGFLAVLAPYRLRRLTSFLDPFADPEGSGYQVVQGWIALATGGVGGTGLGAGVAQRGALPEPHTDFISAVVGQELGAVGWVILVSSYLVLVFRGGLIAHRAKDLFGSLVATAITVLLAIQACINLGVVVGFVPPKGLVLPFMSYGASAVLAHLICVGLLVRISMECAEDEPEASLLVWAREGMQRVLGRIAAREEAGSS